MKANKAELKIHRERCEKRFVSQDLWTQIQTKFAALSDGIKDENADLDKRINQFFIDERESVNKRCEELMKTRFSSYDKVARNFKKFFDEDELQI